MAAILALAALLLQEAKAPFEYAWGKAYHVLPETTSEESGYFSLCEGLNGKIYVGTAKYGQNSFLVEFDPKTEKQRVVLDVHKVCGLTDRGYAAQAKLHTRNYVGPSGRIYVGSKQGYRKAGDTSEYPGGYLIRLEPGTGQAENLGMPYRGQGVIDAVADEWRGLVYVVTCEDQHWMRYDMKSRAYRELGPMLTPYATTLVDRGGKAHAITRDFQLATYDPDTNEVRVRDVLLDGRKWTRPDRNSIPTWSLHPDGRSAYLILMNDARLVSIDLESPESSKRLGTTVGGDHPDSRSALGVGPDGRVTVLVRVDNKTGFGKGYLHHLARYDPATGKCQDLGVVAVKNPEYYDFAAKRPYSHGFHTLPDGTVTPLHAHMGLIVARDGTVYATIIYPFTLLRFDPPKDESKPKGEHPPRGSGHDFPGGGIKKVAALVTAYYHNSHADVIASRILETDTLDGKGRKPRLELASLYTEQISERPPDIGQKLAADHGVRVSKVIEDALTLGTGGLAVDGVLLIAEHGKYPRSAVGQIQYPKRRFFEEVVRVFEKSGRVVPVFVDKHLSDTWEDAKWLYDTAARMKIPLMAGSSLPVLWRDPPLAPARGTELEEVVAISYHTLDAYGFHALEMLQAVVERRKGGETGIRAVECLEGDAVWREGLFDPKLLAAAFGRQLVPSEGRGAARVEGKGSPTFDEKARKSVKSPVLFRIEYADGLRASVLTLNPAVREWAIAWRTKSGEVASTAFRTQEARPFMHFAHLLQGVESMVHSGKPAWPAERTLLTSGALDLLHVSKSQAGKRLDTPQLTFSYDVPWEWRPPPPPPPDRPIQGK